MAVVANRPRRTNVPQELIVHVGRMGVVAGVAGDLPHGERGDFLVQAHEAALSGLDGVTVRGRVGRRVMAEQAQEGGLRQEVPHLALRSQGCSPLDDVTEFAPLKLLRLYVDIPSLVDR